MIQSIIERYKRYGWSTPPGEWGAIHNGHREEFHTALDAGDTDALAGMLASMFRDPITTGLVSKTYHEMLDPGASEAVTSMFITNLELWSLYSDSTDLPMLAAPEVGQPVVADAGGFGIMVDTPRHDHYAQRILALNPKTVFEIGGGYGGTALQIMRRSTDTKVIIVDLPETLYLAWYWLAHATDRTIGWYGEGDYDIALMPAQELGAVDVDVAFSSHSLGEMSRETCDRYLRFIEGSARYFYHDNAHKRLGGGGFYASDLFPEVLATELVPRGFREVYRAPTAWAGSGERYWEFLYERQP